jgi:hypothetical protein
MQLLRKFIIIAGDQSQLFDHSILSAGAILTKEYQEGCKLYSDAPAKIVKEIPKEDKYFYRHKGLIY